MFAPPVCERSRVRIITLDGWRYLAHGRGLGLSITNGEVIMKTIALPSMLGFLLCLHTTPAQAIPETWVASNGGGVACTRVAPCATFTAAHAVTDVGGTIKCIDAANFGQVAITKSITIDCTGTNGGIFPTGGGGSAVSIDTAGVDVTLRGLSIEGMGIVTFGVLFEKGNALQVEDCRISGFFGTGVLIQPPAGSASVRAVLTRVQVEKNGNGIQAFAGTSIGSVVVQIRDSVVARNNANGIAANTPIFQAFIAFVVDRTSSILNGGDGIRAQ